MHIIITNKSYAKIPSGYEHPPKNVTSELQAQPQPVFPNGNPQLNRQLSAQFGNLVYLHLKITNRIFVNFQNSRNALKEIYILCIMNSHRNPEAQNMYMFEVKIMKK